MILSLDILWSLLSFALVLGAIPLAAKFARRVGLVDHPDQRKQHDGHIPLIGGLVVIPVFFAIGLLSGLMDIAIYLPLIIGAGLLLVTGVYDDRFQMSAKLKFGVQILAAFIIMQFGGAKILTLGNLFGMGEIELYFTAEVFTLICIVLLVNAVNLMDGLDGLAGGKCAIMFGGLMVVCAVSGAHELFWTLSILVAALCGFLVYNMRSPLRKKASVFMGDAGALALGLVLAWFVIALAQDGTQANVNAMITPISAAWIVGFCIMDAVVQFIRRILNGQNPFYADRGHFHHHLVDAGLSPARASVVIFIVTVVFGVIGVLPLYFHFSLTILAVLWIIVFAIHLILSLKQGVYKALIAAVISRS